MTQEPSSEQMVNSQMNFRPAIMPFLRILHILRSVLSVLWGSMMIAFRPMRFCSTSRFSLLVAYRLVPMYNYLHWRQSRPPEVSSKMEPMTQEAGGLLVRYTCHHQREPKIMFVQQGLMVKYRKRFPTSSRSRTQALRLPQSTLISRSIIPRTDQARQSLIYCQVSVSQRIATALGFKHRSQVVIAKVSTFSIHDEVL